MKCSNCGQELPEDAVVCPFCGAEVEWVPEYSSPDMIRVMIHHQREDARKRAERLEARRKERLERTKSPVQRLVRVLAAVILAVVLAFAANVLIDRNNLSNYGYLKTMAERAVSEGELAEAERYVEAASRLRKDSTDLGALLEIIESNSAAGSDS